MSEALHLGIMIPGRRGLRGGCVRASNCCRTRAVRVVRAVADARCHNLATAVGDLLDFFDSLRRQRSNRLPQDGFQLVQQAVMLPYGACRLDPSCGLAGGLGFLLGDAS